MTPDLPGANARPEVSAAASWPRLRARVQRLLAPRLAAERLARQRAEQALRESAELAQAVEDSVLDHVAVLDAAGRIRAVNAAWREFAAGPLSPLPRPGVGESYLVNDGVLAVLQGREPVFTQEYGCGAAGADDAGERWFMMKVTPLRVARGGAVVVHSDITELKRNEAELARYHNQLETQVAERTGELKEINRALVESERFVRALTDSVPAAIAYWGGDLRCRFANRPYRERFGQGRREVVGAGLRELVGEATYQEIWPHVQDVLQGRPCEYARTLDGPAGQTHFWVTYLPDMVDGRVQGYFVLASEITALRQAQLQLQHANDELVLARDQADAANRAKSAFLANMSHEIRTPMNAILGFAELLRCDSSDPDQARRLDHISQAAHHLMQLINDILDLSKIESGKFTLEQMDFSLARMLAGAQALVAGQARAKGLRLAVDTEGVPDGLRGDPTRLSQALLNLLGNAVKFTERGRVDLRCQVLEETPQGLLMRFEVRDTGIGVAADRLGKLFLAFEQADNTTTRRFGGTGLGLALTRQLARLMGGEAGAQSEEGQGSTFWFTVLLARASAPVDSSADAGVAGAGAGAGANGPALAPPPASVVPGAGPAEVTLRRSHAHARVLVVEDNRFNQEVALATLQRAGLSADIACDGRQAVEMAARTAYDLVLMDLHMPVMDGFDATRALRALPGCRATPILALTANALAETRAACLAAGMNDHIAKPVSPQRLYEALVRWLPEAARLPPAPPHDALATLRARLAGVQGLEPDRGLALAGGRDDIFLDRLREFAACHEDGLPGLDSCLATGQRQRALRMAQLLKSAAAAIGAVALQRLAGSLEAALAQGQALDGLRLAAFDLEYELVFFNAALQDRLPLRPAEEAALEPAMSPDGLDAAIQGLGYLLASGDSGAERFFRDIAAGLRATLGPCIDELAQAVRTHDHGRALAVLEKLRPGLQATAGENAPA